MKSNLNYLRIKLVIFVKGIFSEIMSHFEKNRAKGDQSALDISYDEIFESAHHAV